MSAEIEQELAALVSRECEELGVPGAAVGVLYGDEQLIACHGVTSLADPLPVTPDTLFLIGSTSKTFTATAVMSLVEQGKLELDDLVAQHLPDLPVADRSVLEQVTVGQLFDHTAGWIGDRSVDGGWGDDALAQALPGLLSGAQVTPPGEVMSYNNTSLVVAGHLLERLTGEPFETAVRRIVLEPLGLAATGYFPWEAIGRRMAVGHAVIGDNRVPVPTWPLLRWVAPAGGVASTVRDQLTYAAFHLAQDEVPGQPINASTRRLMQTPRVACRGPLDGVGISWLLHGDGKLRQVQHGGNVGNIQLSSFMLLPELHLAVTVLTNTASKTTLAPELGRRVLDHVLTTIVGQPPEPPPAVQPLTPALAADYAGRYEAGQWDLEVTAEDGRIVIRRRLRDVGDDPLMESVRESFEIPVDHVLVDADVVAPADDPTEPLGDFLRDADGRVHSLRYELRVCRRASA